MKPLMHELKPFGDSLNTVNTTVSVQGTILEVKYQVKLSSFLDLWDKEDAVLTRKIGLWEGTCFEAFIQDSESNEYLEFNFSGTGYWNVFHFLKRDQKLEEYLPLKLTKHRFTTEPKHREFIFSFDLGQMPFIQDCTNLKIGTTCILVNEDQEKEYFAISHHREKPDFHDPRSFVEIS
jgi:hypothetical protein